jgi:hypothetical protein
VYLILTGKGVEAEYTSARRVAGGVANRVGRSNV